MSDMVRVAEIRQENRSGDVSYRDIMWLCDEVGLLRRVLSKAEADRDRAVAALEAIEDIVSKARP